MSKLTLKILAEATLQALVEKAVLSTSAAQDFAKDVGLSKPFDDAELKTVIETVDAAPPAPVTADAAPPAPVVTADAAPEASEPSTAPPMPPAAEVEDAAPTTAPPAKPMDVAEISRIAGAVATRFGIDHVRRLKEFYGIEDITKATAEQNAAFVDTCKEQLGDAK